MKFIPEIEGLRGVSVLIILLFHLQYTVFSGGYIGVDVFFVISGYLMTLIIFRQIDEGYFSYKGFLIRRLKRLSPALIFASACTISAAALLLPIGVFKQIISELIAALTYTSNFYYLIDSDYFSEESLRRPFLHTWSLSVEEQFYIFYPLLLVFAASAIRKGIITIIVIIATLSLAVSILSEELFFYMIPFRTFEFLIGALIAISVRVRSENNLGRPDLYALILFCMMFIPEGALGTTFSNSLIACLVTALLIASCGNGSFVLSSRPLRYLGHISYSFYLFHWPVIVFINELVSPVNTLTGSAVAIATTLVFSVFCRRFIESALTVAASRYRLSAYSLLIPPVVATVLVIFTFATQVKPMADVDDWSADPKGMAKATWIYADKFDGHDFNGSWTRIALLGDSNSKDILNAIYLTYQNVQVSRIGVRHECGVSFAPPIGSHANIKNELDIHRCNAEAESKVARINELKPDLVIVSTYWKPNEVNDVFEVIRSIDAKVILVGPPVFYSKSVPELLEELPKGYTAAQANQAASGALHKKAMALDSTLEKKAKKAGVSYVSRYRLMCVKTFCPVISDDNKLIVGDKFHLTLPGASLLGERMLAAKSLGIE